MRTKINIVFFLALVVVSNAESKFYPTVAYTNKLTPQLAMFAPSEVRCEEEFTLKIVALGEDGEPTSMSSVPSVLCTGPCLSSATDKPTSFSIKIKSIGKGLYTSTTPVRLQMEGYYLFTANDPDGSFLPFGVPVFVSARPLLLRTYWADLHGHSTLSDGLKPPEEYYRWARDVANLDAVALTDHNWALNEEKIEQIRDYAEKWNIPGKFVAFMGFEWAPSKPRTAPARGRPDHKHLLFRRTDEKFVPWSVWQETSSVAQLWELLASREVIVIPHHTGLPHKTFYGTDWSQHNERFERLVEIFSDWGSSEIPEDRYPLPEIEPGNFVRDAIAAGYHLGFVGGSDTHNSCPGLNTIPRAGHPYALTALTAIKAPKLSRDDLWLALYNRRCYAASIGRRPLLEFKVNDAPMGSRLTEPLGVLPRRISATIASSAPIMEIIIVKNGKQVANFPCKSWCQKIEWIDNEPTHDREDSYYVRAEMEDTSMVWSSPVWVAGPADADISAESRLWRLDGDVNDRRLRVACSEATGITSEKPMILCQLSGAGAIDRIEIDGLINLSEEELREAVVSIRVDNETTPSIVTCLDQLCFVAMGGKPFATAGVAFNLVKQTHGLWLKFMRNLRIPFAHSCTVELSPPSGVTLPHIRSRVTYGLWQRKTLPQLGRMGKCVVRSIRGYKVKGTGTEVELLFIKGRGLLHSLQLAMRNPESIGQYMEGNIEIYVDGEAKPSYASSGTEEFFYGGIYFINPFWTPDGGCTLSIHEPDNTERRTSAYRIFAKDPITFNESLRIVWHNGQQGQGDVPGTTIIDAQSVVYLQREDDRTPTNNFSEIDKFAARLALLDGDPETGRLVAETRQIGTIAPGQVATLFDINGAGHLCRIQLALESSTQQHSSARLLIIRDNELICSEPLGLLFGTGGIKFNFTAGFVGQTVAPNGSVYLQRELIIPHNKSLKIKLMATKDTGLIKGTAFIERRTARDGKCSNFGLAQEPLIIHSACEVTEVGKVYRLFSKEIQTPGQVREIGVVFSGLDSNALEIPVKIILQCDGENVAIWHPQDLVAGLDTNKPGAYTSSNAICLRQDSNWSALVSLKEHPFYYHQNVSLLLDSTGLTSGTMVSAHCILGRKEDGEKRRISPEEIVQRLTALDGGVLAGSAICRTVLENSDIMPGESGVLLDLPGYGTLRCIRIGTPFSATALRRSKISITPSAIQESPTVLTTTDHLFATRFDPFPFWEGAEYIVRPTQLYRQKGGHHTSAFRLLNLPFWGRCQVVLSAAEDDAGAMEWLKQNLPGKTPRDVLLGDMPIPEHIRQGLLQSADVGLFVQVYANRTERQLDWGRWKVPHIICVEGTQLQPGQEVVLGEIKGCGILQGLQLAFENAESPVFQQCSIEAYVDGETTPSWSVANLESLFLGTPVMGSGEGKQSWEDPTSRGRGARGAGNRLMSSVAGTTIFTATAPYRFGGIRNFLPGGITFEKSLRLTCRNPATGASPTTVWSLVMCAIADETAE